MQPLPSCERRSSVLRNNCPDYLSQILLITLWKVNQAMRYVVLTLTVRGANYIYVDGK